MALLYSPRSILARRSSSYRPGSTHSKNSSLFDTRFRSFIDFTSLTTFNLPSPISPIGVAAYKWSLVARTLGDIPETRGDDYLFGGIPGATGRVTSIRVDDTILPGCTCAESKVFGV